jgi:hypothetical protein
VATTVPRSTGARTADSRSAGPPRPATEAQTVHA